MFKLYPSCLFLLALVCAQPALASDADCRFFRDLGPLKETHLASGGTIFHFADGIKVTVQGPHIMTEDSEGNAYITGGDAIMAIKLPNEQTIPYCENETFTLTAGAGQWR